MHFYGPTDFGDLAAGLETQLTGLSKLAFFFFDIV